jgi:transposase
MNKPVTHTDMGVRSWAEQREAERDFRRQWLQSLADMGLGSNEAARLVEVDRSGMSRMAIIHGVKFEAQKAKIAKLSALAGQGYSKKEAAELVGLSYMAVVQIAKKAGLKFADGRKSKPALVTVHPKIVKTRIKASPKPAPKPRTMAEAAALENAALKSGRSTARRAQG